MSHLERLAELGIDPIIPLAICAHATGLSQGTLKVIARDNPDQLEVVRMSERRCGIRRSVLETFLKSRQSAVPVMAGKARGRPSRLGSAGKLRATT